MNIAIVESFYGGSHQRWVDSLVENLDFNFTLFTLPARHWKWRMEASAITLSNKINESNSRFDLIIISDMVNLSLFRSLLQFSKRDIPVLLYFHENQFAYPWSLTDEDPGLKRDKHYQFINFTSALTADKICFNSLYNLNSFINAVPDFLKGFPDKIDKKNIEQIKSKSSVLPLAFNFENSDPIQKSANKVPVILWNHRWEYDKGPDMFFNTLFSLKEEHIPFKLIVTGESYSKVPPIFKIAGERLKNEIIHFGYADSRNDYIELLKKADIIPVCSDQDFFGISIIEAINLNTFPLLPDRLAYPEHIPPHLKNIFLYDRKENFLTRLKQIINERDNSSLQNLKHYLKRYDWKILKEVYSKTFKEMI